MMRQHRGSRGIMAGVGALALFGAISCTDLERTGERRAALAEPGRSTPPNGAKAKRQTYKSDEVLVRFKSGTASGSAAAVHAGVAARVVREYRAPSGLQLVRLPQSITVEAAVEAYRRDPRVLYAEPNYIYNLHAVPNDPSFGQLWGMNNDGQFGVVDADINAPEAWDITTGSSGVVLGLLDSGVDYHHQDLAANIFTNPGEIAGNGIDDDGNGWVDDVHGIDAIGESGDPMDTDGHGTHVSGTMAARGNNGVGVAGVNWDAKVVACKAFNGFGDLDDILQCMDYFLELKTRPNNPVDIVATNNSWGGGPFSQALSDAIGAHQQAGMLFVAAAGNNGSDTDLFPNYPSGYDHANIISVLSLDRFDQRSFFSNFGVRTVDVGAPGEEVLSTLPGDGYGVLSGTSMAAPHVTGLVGLLKAQNPSRTAQQLKNLILTGGAPSPATAGATLSGRRVRADGSLNCTNQTLVNRFAPTTSSLAVGVGTPIPLGLLSITCEAPSPGSFAVTVVETGATVPLVDGDGSGQFAGTYTPAVPGTTTLAFPNGDSVSVTAVGNYDPAAVVPFDFPAINGTPLPLQCDDCTSTIEVPFPIPFAGASPGLTTLHISSNGLLSFSAPNASFSNVPLPTPSFETLIAPFWDDLLPAAGGSIRYEVLGQAPGRQLVIEYRDVPHISVGGASTFQVVFFEGSPTIRFNYADVQFDGGGFADFGASATVGVQVTSGIAQPFSFGAPSLSNNLSLLWTMGTPLAVAGPDQVVLPDAAVTLDGTASHDADGTIVSYAWAQVAGTPVTLTGADTATPSFTAPAGSGTLTFQLAVTDDEGKTATDSVNVTVNRPPVAAAGNDLTTPTDLPAVLDGTASFDPDGFITGYQWTQLAGAPVQIENGGTPVATFVAPPAAGGLVFQLTVTDQFGFTSTDTVVANVFLNLKPVANAGQDRIAPPGASVTLDGTASYDPDGTVVSYAWTVTTCFTIDGPCDLTLDGADTATPQFQAPASPGIIALELKVTDDAGAATTDTVVISAFLQAPAAAIVADTSCVQGGSAVTLNGTGSSDADGTVVAYEWTQLSGPPVPLSGADTAIASFRAPTEGTLVFALTVTDGDGLTDTAEITIPIAPLPAANATASDAVVKQGEIVSLDGSQSVGAVSYSWKQLDGAKATFSDASAVSPTFMAPRPRGVFDVLTFELTVTDVCGITAADTVSLTVLK
ncbi:MAG TPA: S8 family serine peptidase [Polyangiaceae bacterium]|nr:S8 family serine peptidase [Polyangiaceae bacterium]